MENKIKRHTSVLNLQYKLHFAYFTFKKSVNLDIFHLMVLNHVHHVHVEHINRAQCQQAVRSVIN